MDLQFAIFCFFWNIEAHVIVGNQLLFIIVL